MKTSRIQNWYSTVIALMPKIELKPRKKSDESKREVRQKQLITPSKSDIEGLDEPDASLDIALRLANPSRGVKKTFKPIITDSIVGIESVLCFFTVVVLLGGLHAEYFSGL